MAPETRLFSATMASWMRLRADPTVTACTIVCEGNVAGHVVEFLRDGVPEVTYWLGREFWNRGIATAALSASLARPRATPGSAALHARVRCELAHGDVELAHAAAAIHLHRRFRAGLGAADDARQVARLVDRPLKWRSLGRRRGR